MNWKKCRNLLLLSCCLGGMQPAAAQRDTLFLPVDRLFELGLKHSLQLQADALEENAARIREQGARADRLPDLEVGLRGGFVGQPVVFRRGLSDPYRPDAPDWSQNYAVDFSQPIYRGGKLRHAIRRAGMERSLAALQSETDAADLKLNLLEAYLQLFCLYRQQKVLSRNIEESERRLHDIRHMKEEGLITNNDVLRSEMQLTDDRLALQQAENDIALVSQQLDILLGLDEELLIRPDTALLHRSVVLKSYDYYVEEACAADPTMKRLRVETDIARTDIDLARAALRPEISLYASNTLARPISRTMEDLYNNNWNIGLSVSVPIFSLYKSSHKVRESRLAVSLHRNAEEQEMQRIRVRVRTALLRHREAVQQVEALQLSERQARENYRIMQNRYMNQLAILTDLLDANSVRLDVELQLTEARTRVIYTYHQLLRACGQL